ncbi:MAG: DUF6275 family protein [Culicoidibacterales bacterium]
MMESNFQLKAMSLCQKVMKDAGLLTDNEEVFVVWFSKTLQNWKALVATKNTHLYFEVTHNGNANETYVDMYDKVSNTKF